MYIIFLLFILSFHVQAKNIDLSTVPNRETVQLTIYNTEDLTLVRETRHISFKEGANTLQFSWANTLIDPTSVQLKFLTHSEDLEVLETRFPHDKPQMLYWVVDSQLDGTATIEITYFTSGISWKADYTAIANPEETEMMLESFIKVINHSGEDYENAQVRLIVGTINLVETIRQLAQPYITTNEDRSLLSENKRVVEKNLSKQALGFVAGKNDGYAGGLLDEVKQVVKESFSEYFMYTIEGTETIPHNWAKRLRSFKTQAIPFSIEYRYRPAEYGHQLVRLYLMRNDIESKLGTTPLPEGIIRIFKQNKNQGLNYLAQENLKYIPIGDKIELNLGVDPDIYFELVKTKVFRDHILMKEGSKNIYRPLLDPYNAQISYNHHIAGWNDNIIYQQRIYNYTDKPIQIEIRRSFDGDIIFESNFAKKLYDYRTIEYTTKVDSGEKKSLAYTVTTRQGKNAKKNNIELKSSQ